jgi:hypothetical protein
MPVFERALATVGGDYQEVNAALISSTIALMEQDGTLRVDRRSRSVPLGAFILHFCLYCIVWQHVACLVPLLAHVLW